MKRQRNQEDFDPRGATDGGITTFKEIAIYGRLMSFILYIATCERQNVTASSNQNLFRHYMTSPARSLKIVRPDFWLNCYDDTAQFSSFLVGVGGHLNAV